MFISVLAFVITMIITYWHSGGVPDSLIEQFFGFFGIEGGALAIIKVGEAFAQKTDKKRKAVQKDGKERKQGRMKEVLTQAKAMLSQPMAGKTEQEIKETREKAIKALENMGYEIVNTLFTDDWYSKESMEKRGVVQIPLCFLAKSLENMSLCHVAYFCKGWEKARGCKIEHDAAVAYGLKIIYEE